MRMRRKGSHPRRLQNRTKAASQIPFIVDDQLPVIKLLNVSALCTDSPRITKAIEEIVAPWWSDGRVARVQEIAPVVVIRVE